MRHKFLIILALFSAITASFAQDTDGKVKVYGEVINYASYDSRTGVLDETGLNYLLPADKNLNEVGIDLNNTASARFLSIASKFGMSWEGFKSRNMELGSRLEADFYFANGTNTLLRLRKAYFTAVWNINQRNKLSVLVGQNWHPFAIDRPHTISMVCGAPFNPYSFAPQVQAGFDLLNWMSISLGALWQMDFRSTGPQGFSTNYITWSCTPEFYFGTEFKWTNFMCKLGCDILTIKPRQTGLYPLTEVSVPVRDRHTGISAFALAQYNRENLCIKTKSTYAQGGEHLMMFGGYAVSSGDDEGTNYYTPFTSSASWISAEYGKGLKGLVLLAYMQNLGTTKELPSKTSYWYYRSDAYNLSKAFRASPAISFTYKHLKIGLEYEFTGAQYGTVSKDMLSTGIVTDGLHWVFSHRLIALAACIF